MKYSEILEINRRLKSIVKFRVESILDNSKETVVYWYSPLKDMFITTLKNDNVYKTMFKNGCILVAYGHNGVLSSR